MKTNRSRVRITLLITALLFASCTKEYTEEVKSPISKSVQYEGIDPSGGKPAKIEYKGQQINVVDMGDYYIWMGDIKLRKADVAKANNEAKLKGAGLIHSQWKYGNVYYRIDPSFPSPERITRAIEMIEANVPGLRFINSNTATNYINIQPSGGSFSTSIGVFGGEQIIGLSGNAGTGVVVHELMHAVGVFHEQSRADRDNFIRVNYNNIPEDWRPQYDTYVQRGEVDGFDNGPFDFNSIMLYPSIQYYPGTWSMVNMQGQPFTSQRENMSAGDIAILRFLYPSFLEMSINGVLHGDNDKAVNLSLNLNYSRDYNSPTSYLWQYKSKLFGWTTISTTERASIKLPYNEDVEVMVTVTFPNGASKTVIETIKNESSS